MPGADVPKDDDAITPFTLSVSDDEIADLRERLARTRWPDQLPDAGWDYGTERTYLQSLCEHWRTEFDWPTFVARANAFPQYLTTIDGQRIHFIHARSPEPTARPLIVTHGWPGSVAEFFDVIGPLSDPAAHGLDPATAFHVVMPSLPGYGFSGPTTERGWDTTRTARAFGELMTRLGYDRFFAQGGDWGSAVTNGLATQFAERVPAIHLNLVAAGPPAGEGTGPEHLTEAELARVVTHREFLARETGYQAIQSTKPQTLAYGLTDSPAGLAGWIVEKFRTWSDCDGDLTRSYTPDRLLENIAIYWLTGTINSSTRMYYESLGSGRAFTPPPSTVPLGHASYPGEIYRAPRRWVEAAYNVVHWTDMPRGGHFAAMEVPDLFVEDLRAFFSTREL